MAKLSRTDEHQQCGQAGASTNSYRPDQRRLQLSVLDRRLPAIDNGPQDLQTGYEPGREYDENPDQYGISRIN